MIKSESVILLYKNGLSMRQIGKKFNTNHKLISRILKRNKIRTRKTKNTRNKRKFKNKKDVLLNNMKVHIRFKVSLKWLRRFEDFEKLKFLNRAITNREGRFNISTEHYKKYIEKFYYDKNFNYLYKKWISNNKLKHLKPSIDHIVPKSKGGTNKISNLQFLTWLENRCKNNMSESEWDTIKNNLSLYFKGIKND